MRSEIEENGGLWRDNFEKMAEAVHTYIQTVLDNRSLEYEELEGGRSEVETGYIYSCEYLDFKFSLAGTVNGDPEILKDGRRKIVLQAETVSESYRTFLESLEDRKAGEIELERYKELELCEFEVDPPYS